MLLCKQNHLIQLYQRSSLLLVDPDEKDKENRSALSIASATNHISAVESLLTAQASLNSCDRHQWNALCYAADAGNVEIVERLLLAGSRGLIGHSS